MNEFIDENREVLRQFLPHVKMLVSAFERALLKAEESELLKYKHQLEGALKFYRLLEELVK